MRTKKKKKSRTVRLRMPEPKVFIDGDLVPKSKAKISVFDHGLLYGDGVFEGIRAYNGRIFKLDEHLDRLFHSARALILNIPLTKEQIKRAVIRTLLANHLSNAYIRLVVTRGEGDLGLDPKKCSRPSVLIITDVISLYPEVCYENGLEVSIVATRRNIPEALSPAIKSLNYLNNILAKIEADRIGVSEAILLNREGFVAECTGDNIFAFIGGKLLTPPTSAGILAGITRAVAMELAKHVLRIPVGEENITSYDLYVADEVFLTGTAAEIIPVVKIDSRVIGNGKPGIITRRLMGEFRRLTLMQGVRFSLAGTNHSR